MCVCLLGTLANIRTYFCIFAVLFFCRRHIKLIRRAPFVFASLYSIYFAVPFAFLSLSLSLIALPNAARKSRQWFFSCSASLLVGAASYCRGTCYPPYTPPHPSHFAVILQPLLLSIYHGLGNLCLRPSAKSMNCNKFRLLAAC